MNGYLDPRHFRPPSPASWGAYLGLTFLTAILLLLSGCTTAPPRPHARTLIPLRGFYSFSGSVAGTHRYRLRSEPFTVTLHGTVEFRPDQVRVDASRGSCTRGVDEVDVLSNGHVAFSCGSVHYDFGQGSGGASLFVREERERRGGCTEYERLPDGRPGRCLDWLWEIYSVRRRAGTELAMREGGTTP